MTFGDEEEAAWRCPALRGFRLVPDEAVGVFDPGELDPADASHAARPKIGVEQAGCSGLALELEDLCQVFVGAGPGRYDADFVGGAVHGDLDFDDLGSLTLSECELHALSVALFLSLIRLANLGGGLSLRGKVDRAGVEHQGSLEVGDKDSWCIASALLRRDGGTY